MNPSGPFSGSIEDQAADWLARRDAGFTPAESAEFEGWLAADPRHTAAVRELADAWSLLQQPRASGQARRVLSDLEQRFHLRRSRRANRLIWVASGVAAAAIALGWWLPKSITAPAIDAPAITVTPRPERRVLPDGSVVELNASAEITIAFTATRRYLQLQRGEAHFTVIEDPARPFVVSAGGIESRAVGTAFSVRFSDRDVRVLVTEGLVAVVAEASASPSSPVLVSAGARVTVPLTAGSAIGSPEVVSPAEVAQALVWRSQRVEFSGTTLAEAVALFNRQNRVQLTITGDGLGAMRLSGIYWANDPVGFSRLIGSSFGLRVEVRGDDELAFCRP